MNKMSLKWEAATYSRGAIQIAEFVSPLGHTFRYAVRRLRPHAREWIARRDGEDFTGRTFSTIEEAMHYCEIDVSQGPASRYNLDKVKADNEIRALENSLKS